jgi:predicted nucleotidyltransferase
MKTISIPLDDNSVEDLRCRHHIERLSPFGSVLYDDFRPDSDVGFWVDIGPTRTLVSELVVQRHCIPSNGWENGIAQ